MPDDTPTHVRRAGRQRRIHRGIPGAAERRSLGPSSDGRSRDLERLSQLGDGGFAAREPRENRAANRVRQGPEREIEQESGIVVIWSAPERAERIAPVPCISRLTAEARMAHTS